MRFYLVTALVTILLLVCIISYKQELFRSDERPYDSEQTGLGDQTIIHFSHVVAENTPKGLAATKFAQLVEEKSKGKMIVQIYPNGIMYHDGNEMKALRNGDVQMIAPTISKVSAYLPNWQVLDLPFLIENDAQLYTILHGKLSEQLLAELDQIDVKGMTFWTNGFKQMASKNTPLLQVDDFKNLTFRTMNSTILRKQFALLRATTIVTTFNDLYYELTAEDVLGQENTISNIYSKSYYDLHPNITLSNHGILAYAVLFNQDFWQSLTPEQQAIISESLEEIRVWQHEQAIMLNQQNLEVLKQNEAVTLYKLTEHQQHEWKKQLEPIYNYYTASINKQYVEQLLHELHPTIPYTK